MSFGSSDTSALSQLTGNQQNNNLYDPDKAYVQKLMAYEMYGNQGVTGSEYNPFNTGPSTADPDPKAYTDAPPDWQHGNGYMPNSPITPNDTLPPPYGGKGNGDNVWNPGTGQWQADPLPPPSGGDPGGGGGNPTPFGPGHLPTADGSPARPIAQNLPTRHEGDPGTDTNPLQNPENRAPYTPMTDEEARQQRLNHAQNSPQGYGRPAPQQQPNQAGPFYEA